MATEATSQHSLTSLKLWWNKSVEYDRQVTGGIWQDPVETMKKEWRYLLFQTELWVLAVAVACTALGKDQQQRDIPAGGTERQGGQPTEVLPHELKGILITENESLTKIEQEFDSYTKNTGYGQRFSDRSSFGIFVEGRESADGKPNTLFPYVIAGDSNQARVFAWAGEGKFVELRKETRGEKVVWVQVNNGAEHIEANENFVGGYLTYITPEGYKLRVDLPHGAGKLAELVAAESTSTPTPTKTPEPTGTATATERPLPQYWSSELSQEDQLIYLNKKLWPQAKENLLYGIPFGIFSHSDPLNIGTPDWKLLKIVGINPTDDDTLANEVIVSGIVLPRKTKNGNYNVAVPLFDNMENPDLPSSWVVLDFINNPNDCESIYQIDSEGIFTGVGGKVWTYGTKPQEFTIEELLRDGKQVFIVANQIDLRPADFDRCVGRAVAPFAGWQKVPLLTLVAQASNRAGAVISLGNNYSLAADIVYAGKKAEMIPEK